MKKKSPFDCVEIIEKDESEIQAIIKMIEETSLSDDIKALVIKCIHLAVSLPLFLQKQSMTLKRLRVMLFGKGYRGKKNKKSASSHDKDPTATPPAPSGSSESDVPSHEGQAVDPVEEQNTPENALVSVEPCKKKQPGHGRMSHTVYTDATDIPLSFAFKVGDPCPESCGGTLRFFRSSAVIRVKGQNFAHVYRYTWDTLRCTLCQMILRPALPPEAGSEKYDASFKSIVALSKYFVAVPFYRQERFQNMLSFPLSDATQWDLIEQLAACCYTVFDVLQRLAANARLIHHDDTRVAILEVIQEIKNRATGDRTGMYTTGMVADYEGHCIALFMNGRQHSGENIRDVLQHRDPEKEMVLQMCDALSANIPKGLKTIVCHCLAHGFRKFDELKDFFEPECLTILRLLGQVFQNDAVTRTMSHTERLEYHQEHSQSLMDALKTYMDAVIEEKIVEPNSELGRAIHYMQRHWEKLMRFLSVAGAPIDNNIVERALKIAIRNRKSAMFYRTVYSAGIGGMITSIIYTCHLAKANPHHYLTVLQTHAKAIAQHPEQWLPWNYRVALSQVETASWGVNAANASAHGPPVGNLVAA